MAIRVVVGEDSLLVREGICELLASEPDVDVVAAVGDLPALERAVADERPDVVLTDIRMPPGGSDEGIRLAMQLRDGSPQTGVVVLSAHSDPATPSRSSSAGRTGGPTCSRTAWRTARSCSPPSVRWPPAGR